MSKSKRIFFMFIHVAVLIIFFRIVFSYFYNLSSENKTLVSALETMAYGGIFFMTVLSVFLIVFYVEENDTANYEKVEENDNTD